MLKDGAHDAWTPWFAWYPVRVDVYHVTDISNDGRMNYRVWLQSVEYAFAYGSKERPTWKYRLPPLPTLEN